MTQETTPAQPPKKKPRRKRRWPWVLLLFAMILILGVILTPAAISTSPGKAFLVGRINARMPGKVQIEELSVGWLSGMSVRGLTLRDPEGKEIAVLRDAVTEMTLLDAVRGQYRLGNTRVAIEKIAIERDAKGTTNLQRALGTQESASAGNKPATTQAATESGVEKTANKIVEASGNISLMIDQATWCDAQTTLDAQATAAKISFDTAGLPATVEFSTSLKTSGQGSSEISVNGTADLFHRQRIRPIHEMKFQGSAVIKELDLGSLKGMLATLGAQILPSGQLDVTLNFDTSQTTTVARGEVRLKDFSVSGSAIKGGTLALGSVSIPMDAQLQSDGLKIRKLDVVIAPTPEDLVKKPDMAIRLGRNSVLNWSGGENHAYVGLEYDLARLATIFKAYMPADTQMAGRYSAEFRVIGTLTDDEGVRKFRQFTLAHTKFGFDSIQTGGLNLEKSELVLALINGVLKIGPSRIPANGGELNLAGNINLNNTPATYELDAPLELAKGVQMNKQIAAGPLAFLPIAWGLDAGKMQLLDARGALNVRIDRASLPITWSELQKQGTANGNLNIEAFSSNSPIVNEVLSALGPIAKITQTNWALPEQNIRDIAFSLSAGRVSYKNFVMKAGTATFEFSGHAGLDKTLDMTLNVAESKLNLSVPVMIRGTTGKPDISVSQNAIQKTIQQSAPALIESLLDRRKREKEKK